MEELNWLFVGILPLVAFMYAAVGHGGASGYLAMMSLFAFPVEVMKPTGLLLNLFVAGISFISFYRTGNFNLRLFFVFALASIPLSFLGGLIEIETKTYKLILGVLLLFAVVRMLNIFNKENKEIRPINLFSGSVVGGLIGFFSGLIGIGGGIILSPVILLMRWGTVKEAAAVSALFIWVNSASGMLGQLVAGIVLDSFVWIYVGVALAGGFLGGYVGSSKMSNSVLNKVLALVLVLASIKLLFV